MTEKIVGYTDAQGYLRCVACAGEEKRIMVVYEDNAAFWGEPCDVCGEVVVAREIYERDYDAWLPEEEGGER